MFTVKIPLRHIKLLLATVLLWGLATLAPVSAAESSTQTTPTAFDETQTQAIKRIVQGYLLEHPEIILESIALLQEREEEANIAAISAYITENEDEIKFSPTAFVAGNPNGDVTIVEFFDYQCGYCKRSFQDLLNMVNKDKRIRLVYKEFPVLGPASTYAAKASMAAMNQDKFMEFHLALMKSKGKLTEPRIDLMAKNVGIDLKKLRKDMDKPIMDEVLARNREFAGNLGIEGTPSFVVGDLVVPGLIPMESMKQLVEAVRKDKIAATAGTAAGQTVN